MEVVGLPIWYVVYCGAAHFMSSGLAGLLVFLLMQTMLSSITGCRGSATTIGAGFSIYRLSFLLALSSSVLVHILVDFTTEWF